MTGYASLMDVGALMFSSLSLLLGRAKWRLTLALIAILIAAVPALAQMHAG